MTRARRAVHLFAVALQLLTRIPVRVRGYDENDLRAARAFFPLVGIVVAAIGVAARAGTGWLLGTPPATVIAVAAMVAATGAFHEDGLADSADGLWGGHDPERRLAIMHDSRVGTYGVIALVLTMLLRVALLVPLDVEHFARAVLAGHVLGRSAGVVLSATVPPASDQGLGAKAAAPPGAPTWLMIALCSATAAVIASPVFAVLPVVVALAVIAVVHRIASAKLGGVTGDLLGAVNQLTELSVLTSFAALATHGLV